LKHDLGHSKRRNKLLLATGLLLTLAFFAKSSKSEGVTLTTLPPGVVSVINVTEINRTLIYASFHEELRNALKPADVWVVNTQISSSSSDESSDSTNGSGGLNFAESVTVAVSKPIEFDSWSNQTGILASDGTEQLDIQHVSSNFPNEQISLRLWIGSNDSIDPPIVTTSIPTYQVTEQYTDYSNQSVPSPYRNNSYLPQLFTSCKYVIAIDLYLSHPAGFAEFARVAYYTPALVLGFAVLIVILSIRRPVGAETDYVQGVVTLLLFYPLFALGIGQFVPTGQSTFLEDWLSSIALITAGSFVGVAICTVIVILRKLV